MKSATNCLVRVCCIYSSCYFDCPVSRNEIDFVFRVTQLMLNDMLTQYFDPLLSRLLQHIVGLECILSRTAYARTSMCYYPEKQICDSHFSSSGLRTGIALPFLVSDS